MLALAGYRTGKGGVGFEEQQRPLVWCAVLACGRCLLWKGAANLQLFESSTSRKGWRWRRHPLAGSMGDEHPG
jgi:hypothetical protein